MARVVVLGTGVGFRRPVTLMLTRSDQLTEGGDVTGGGESQASACHHPGAQTLRLLYLERLQLIRLESNIRRFALDFERLGPLNLLRQTL